jgi:hypothetical protein
MAGVSSLEIIVFLSETGDINGTSGATGHTQIFPFLLDCCLYASGFQVLSSSIKHLIIKRLRE